MNTQQQVKGTFMFILDSEGDFRHAFGDPARAVRSVPPGAYRQFFAQGYFYLKPIRIETEHLVELDTPVALRVRQEVDMFFNPEITARIHSANLKHRRGIILYGQPGTGKTSLIMAMVPTMISQGAIVLIEPHVDSLERLIIPGIREFNPGVPIVIVLDEFEGVARSSRTELKQLLDGMTSPDGLLTLACTNFIDQIPTELSSRPSRFSSVLEMPAPSPVIKEHYVRTQFPMIPADTIPDLIQVAGDRPFDYLQEVCRLFIMGYGIGTIRDMVNGQALSGTIKLDISAWDMKPRTGDDDDDD